jgi:hypothetical protein
MVEVIDSFHPVTGDPQPEARRRQGPLDGSEHQQAAGAPREFEPAVLDAISEWLKQRTSIHGGADYGRLPQTRESRNINA